MASGPDGGRTLHPSDYERFALRHPEAVTPNAAAFNPRHDLDRDASPVRPADSLSLHSTTPLAPQVHKQPMPPFPLGRGYADSNGYDSGSPYGDTPGSSARPAQSRTSSWDLLSGLRKFEHEYSEYDSRNASTAHLRFADGDLPKNKVSKVYNYLLNVSIVTRWFLFIVPVLGILWIPGILGLTAFPDAKIWNVKLIWWSIWLSVLWGGWWAALATARILPRIVRSTLGVVSFAVRRYADWILVLQRYIALWSWTLSIWIAFNPLINKRSVDGQVAREVSLITKLLFAFFLCASVLLFEKYAIQWIAWKFHERSYADRIAEQKRAVKILVTLYQSSTDIPGRTDTLVDKVDAKPKQADPARFFKRALKGVRVAATTTTTALGNVASEIAGSSVLQPDSPQAKVQTALASANKSRLLARRLYYSFRAPGRDVLVVQDLSRFFPTAEEAETAFAFFDKDDNGDASRDEIEMAVLECHREQLSLEHSMKDLDSAVGRLDNILMSLYVVIAILIVAVALETQLVTIITGAGTLILGLSWLIGGSLQEVLSSIIFLFIKHPYDVGDRVDIEKVGYTVKEIRLLSTIFLDLQGCQAQAPNNVLNTKFIQNIRRSPQMSEKFEFEVGFGTTFEQIEKLRAKMLAFVKDERRDFLPSFDVVVVDFPGQEKLVLSADIKYKSNWQQGAVKVKRRNKWICALKTALLELEVYGPGGNPDAEPEPAMYTQVPWEEVQAKKREKEKAAKEEISMPQPLAEPRIPRADYSFTDKNALIQNDDAGLFGESDALYMTNPRSGYDTPRGTVLPQRAMPPPMPGPARPPRTPGSGDEIEMTAASRPGQLRPGQPPV